MLIDCLNIFIKIFYSIILILFQAARPVADWEGVFDAFNEHVRCPQRFGPFVTGTEDCLTLNVYTPLPAPDHLLPVMVFIHGGGFRDGSGSPFIYGPEYLIKHGVVLVTFNYRVEVLGFLCLGTKEAPGNAGLKDQVLALKWVKKNIKSFGGDPDQITIFGESAGSASVVYHILSPLSEGLFHRAILQSGSALSPWSLQLDPVKTASLLAKNIGYNVKKPSEIYDVLRNVSAKVLLETRVPREEGDIVNSENIFVPCVEKNLPNEELFLPDTPYNLLAAGNFNKVPVIMGYNNAEGFMFAGKENDTTIAKLDIYKALPRDLQFPTDDERKRTAEVLHRYYMGNKKISKETLAEFSRFVGDSSITYPVVSTIEKLLQADVPVFGYKFSYSGWMNLAKFTSGFWKYPGATHADELFYLFKIRILVPGSLFETNFINFFTTLWTNFAKFGDPTPPASSTLVKWEPANKINPKVYEINTNCSLTPLWDDEIFRYWDTIYEKYRRLI
nr:putative antennal esterase CXE20 [Ectropis grisescens]